MGGTAPRPKQEHGLFLSTAYPKEFKIPQHFEMAYHPRWPMKVFFYCEIPAPVGGETPIFSARRFMKCISPKLVEKFTEKKVAYLRNYTSEIFSLKWQDVFQTEDKAVVDDFCRKNFIQTEWRKENQLRTWGLAQGVAIHPKTGETFWHNHSHVYCSFCGKKGEMTPFLGWVPPSNLKSFFISDPNELPMNATYGDGTYFELSTINEINEIFEREKVSFPWNKGDFIVLDNMLTSHGRNAYDGDRKILAILKEEHFGGSP